MAAIRRTSTLIVRGAPSRSNSPVSRTRSSLACTSSGSSPISSRKSVPPSATSKRPRFADGPGEGALLVAEQLALDERRRHGRAVDGDERPLARGGCARAARARPAPCRCRSRRAGGRSRRSGRPARPGGARGAITSLVPTTSSKPRMRRASWLRMTFSASSRSLSARISSRLFSSAAFASSQLRRVRVAPAPRRRDVTYRVLGGVVALAGAAGPPSRPDARPLRGRLTAAHIRALATASVPALRLLRPSAWSPAHGRALRQVPRPDADLPPPGAAARRPT